MQYRDLSASDIDEREGGIDGEKGPTRVWCRTRRVHVDGARSCACASRFGRSCGSTSLCIRPVASPCLRGEQRANGGGDRCRLFDRKQHPRLSESAWRVQQRIQTHDAPDVHEKCVPKAEVLGKELRWMGRICHADRTKRWAQGLGQTRSHRTNIPPPHAKCGSPASKGRKQKRGGASRDYARGDLHGMRKYQLQARAAEDILGAESICCRDSAAAGRSNLTREITSATGRRFGPQ